MARGIWDQTQMSTTSVSHLDRPRLDNLADEIWKSAQSLRDVISNMGDEGEDLIAKFFPDEG